MISLEYLESERKKIWEQIVELKKEVEKKTSDYESDAKQASKKSSEYKNKCETTSNEARQLLDEIKRLSEDVKQSNIGNLISEIKEAHDNFVPKTEAVAARLKELETLFSAYSTYAEKLKKLDELTATADESTIKIETVFKQITTRKNEVDQIYYDIFGYSDTDSKSGEVTVVTGLKDKLEKSYSELKSDFEKFAKEKDDEFKKTFDGWKSQYLSAHSKIESLLPNALTAGLSAAYSRKKDDELIDHKRLEERFTSAVIALIAVSLIPFVVSIYLITHGATLEETILKMPRLVLAILPLYVPVLWLAYSFNRKMNLSKRLIEEYTHKEVLSKTFEGLSTQIQNIDDSEISGDLKTRLLYNILEVSSENPGKLISNYDKSDHPLMDALDKSVKLHNSIEYLAKVPGMSKLVGILEKRAGELIDKETKKAVDGFESAVSSKV